MAILTATLARALDLYLEAAPWLLFGLLLAGAVKLWLPDRLLARWLGGDGPLPVLKAALAGAPLPLCSCGVLPAAIGLRRAGASRGATVSFLVATPETGPDSITVSYALLGPFMAVARPVAAVLSAVVAGSLAGLAREPAATDAEAATGCCCGGCASERTEARPGLKEVGRFVFVEVLGDMAGWLVVGFLLAGAVVALVPPTALVAWGGGVAAKLVMVAVGVPLYICATASTPLAAAMIAAGVSPGTALVFLLVGPATNGAGLAILGRELGRAATVGYLAGVIGTALAAGFVVDFLAASWQIDMVAQSAASAELLPPAVGIVAAVILAAAAAPTLWRGMERRLRAA